MDTEARMTWARGQALRVIDESAGARKNLQVVALERAMSWEMRLTATALLRRLDTAIAGLRTALVQSDANAVLRCTVDTTRERRQAEAHLRTVMGPAATAPRPPRIPPVG